MATRGEAWQAEVVKVLQKRKEPLSAYEILGELQDTHPKLAPQTIYRALTALTETRRIHRLESMNAYMACQCSATHEASILAICGSCGTVDESVAPDVLADVSSVMAKSGFSVQRHVIEVHGTCSNCGSGAVA